MILNVYTLHDAKAGEYNQPFFTNNHALANRLVSDLVVDPNTTVGRHPRDFRLYCLGTYDTSSGVITSFPAPEHVSDAAELLPAIASSLPFDIRTTDPRTYMPNKEAR